MRRLASATLAVLLLCPSTSAAHRLDEYLQATRIAVARDRIALELDLTPGSSIASDIVALIDRNRDNRISPFEAEAYGTMVLTGLVVLLDEQQMALTLDGVDVPPIGDMRDGVGSIRIKTSAVAANGPGAGHRLLYYRNDHAPNGSVYLVNALMPGTGEVSITKQRRDQRQREFHLEFDVATRGVAAWWSLAAALILSWLTLARTRRGIRDGAGAQA